MEYTLKQLEEILGIPAYPSENAQHITQFVTDTRNAFDPEHSLFIALDGPFHNGHQFITQAWEAGIRSFLVSEPVNLSDVHLLQVPDTLAALQKIASYHRAQFRMPVIGITGSNGKTIVKEWLNNLLSPDFNIIRSPKSYNSQLGVALSVLQMEAHHNLALIEAGISLRGEMENLEKIIKPDLVILTNIGPAHDEGFENRKQKIKEKLILAENCDCIVAGIDQPEVLEILNEFKSNHFVKFFTWSFTQNATIKVSNVKIESRTTLIEFIYKSNSLKYRIPFTDQASIENSLTCVCVLLALERLDNTHLEAFEALEPVEMRLEIKKGINQSELICDYYNADIISLGIALDFLTSRGRYAKRTVILSDIPASGIEPEILYKQIGDILESRGISKLYTIGDEIGKAGLAERFGGIAFRNTDAFLMQFDTRLLGEESMLLKGARRFTFEKIAALLSEKAHRTTLEINLSAVSHNLKIYRNALVPGTKMMVMVKAFAYGSGSVELARLLQFHNVEYLAVAYADEGVDLRRSGIRLPIMVMNPEPEAFRLMFDYKLEPEIYSMDLLEAWELAAEGREGAVPGIHLEFDTGMHRLGFEINEAEIIALRIKEMKRVKVVSCFSHLASSEDPEQNDFTILQGHRFTEAATLLQKKLGYGILKHISNSGGIAAFPGLQFDMVRLGIGLHGIDPTGKIQDQLMPVSRLKTVISQIRNVKQGEGIGYNSRTHADKDMEVAVAAIGYADGLPRALGNKVGALYINEKPVQIVGSVCMDMCMLDVTGLGVKAGDEVYVFYDTKTLLELSSKLNTIPYEVLTQISGRVRRNYYQE